MPNPANTARVTLFGALAGGEDWSSSFGLAGATVPATDGDANTSAHGIWNLFTTSGGWYRALWAPSTTIAGVKVTWYGGGGSVGVAQGLYNAPSAFPGTGSAIHPDQCCLVATLRTGAPGRSKRGRMYFPATGAALGSDALLAGTLGTDFVTGLADVFVAINAAPDAIGTVSVISATHTATRPVTTVDCDQRLDIQRRRANQENVGPRVTAGVTG